MADIGKNIRQQRIQKNMTQEERELFHLSTLKVTYEEALREYETCAATKLGKLLAAREVPVLRQARAMLDEIN